MIITLAREGQMCNQLMTLAASLANGLELHEKVLCPLTDNKLKDSFSFDDEALPIKVKMWSSKPCAIIAGMVKLAKKVIKIDRFRFHFGKEAVTVYTEWISFKDDRALYHHLDDVRNYFRINSRISDKCSEIMSKIKDGGLPVVGVHIRRGDYKEFREGEYYYTDREYLQWMMALTKMQRCKFVIFSNEDINVNAYAQAGLQVEYLKGSPVMDLCCMSMCDYIMGPPSTYSWWASMYGNNQRLIMEKRDKGYDWSDFRYLADRLIEKIGGGGV